MSEVDPVQLERYLAGELDADARARLARALAEDPALLAAFAADVADARALDAALGAHDDAAALAAARQVLHAKRGASRALARVRRPRARSRAWWLLASATAAAAALVLAFHLAGATERAAPAARLAAANDAWVIENGQRAAAVADQALGASARIETAADGTARWVYADGTAIDLAASSSVALADGAGGRSIDLAAGSLSATVAKQAPGTALSFRTPRALATVVGTRLRLAVDASSTTLRVDEGRVRFAALGARAGETLVEAGGWSLADATGLVNATGGEPSRTLLAWAALDAPLPEWIQGDLVACAPRPDGGERCLEGRHLDGVAVIVMERAGAPLLTFDPGLVLSFDWRVDSPTDWVGLWMKDASSDSEQQGTLAIHPEPGHWTHVDLALADLRPVGLSKALLAPGDLVPRLLIQAQPASSRLRLANLALRVAPGGPRTRFVSAP
jgi:hypothetical protein